MYRITGRGINGVTACRYFTIFKLFSLAFVPVGVLAIYGAYFNNIFENVGTVAYVGSAIALGTYLREHEGLRLRRTVIATVIVPFLFIAILGIGLVALSDSNIPAMIDYQQAMQQKDYKKAEETLIVLVDDELEQGDYMQAAQYALWLARLQNVELENPQQAKETIEGIFSYLPPEEEVKGRKAMALLYRRLAIANLDLNEKEQARENYKKALIAAKGVKDKELEVDLILDVAIEESDAGDHESAQAYLQDALAYKNTMDKGSLLGVYNSIAYTAFEQKNYTLARQYVDKAMPLTKDLPADYGMTLAFFDTKAVLDIHDGHYAEALRLMDIVQQKQKDVRPLSRAIRLTTHGLALVHNDQKAKGCAMFAEALDIYADIGHNEKSIAQLKMHQDEFACQQ